MAVAADPVTGVVYVADPLPGDKYEVAAIDAATGKVTGTVSVPIFPRDVAVNPATDTVYAVGDFHAGAKVVVINGATDAVTTTVALPTNALPVAAAVNPGTHRLHVADDVNDDVDVINTVSDRLTATIPMGGPGVSAMAVDTATNQIYMSGPRNRETVISGATNMITHRIVLPVNAFQRGIAIGSGVVYVADEDANAIWVIDTATDTISATITGVTGVSGVALGGAGTLYAVAPEGGPFGIGVTYVIGTASGKVTAQIPRGAEWVTADAGSAYLSNGFEAFPDSVSVVTPSSATTMCPLFLGPYGVSFTGGQVHRIQLKASASPSASFRPPACRPA